MKQFGLDLMTMHQTWMAAIVAVAIQSGATFADVTLSTSNDPNAAIGASFDDLMGAEKIAIAALSDEQRAALAVGTVTKSKSVSQAKDAPMTYTAQWLAAQDAPSGDAQWECLKTALYFEARGENLEGQFAVAEVILNRVDSVRYPNTICAVVQQGGSKNCQFSFNCDGKAEVMHNPQAADIAGRIARVMIDGAPRSLTDGAMYFHTRSVNPSWSKKFAQTASIGAHLFYSR
jgi:spore germination cell wall hydrolase CwlJ-like protein